MDSVKPEVKKLFAAKAQRRQRLAAMTFPEKVRAVIRLQEMAAPLLRQQGRKVRVWPVERGMVVTIGQS
jgi:hypothetical protein